MAVIIPFPCPPPPGELAAVWALADRIWDEWYGRGLDGPAPPRLTLVR